MNGIRKGCLLWAVGLGTYVIAIVSAALNFPFWMLVIGIAVGFCLGGTYHFGHHNGRYGSWPGDVDDEWDFQDEDLLTELDWDNEWAKWNAKGGGKGGE